MEGYVEHGKSHYRLTVNTVITYRNGVNYFTVPDRKHALFGHIDI